VLKNVKQYIQQIASFKRLFRNRLKNGATVFSFDHNFPGVIQLLVSQIERHNRLGLAAFCGFVRYS